MNNRILGGVLALAVLVGLGAYFYNTASLSKKGPPAIEDGWHTALAGALSDPKPGPRVIVITRAGWSTYEKNTYDRPEIKSLISDLSRARIEFSMDTANMEKWGIDGAPALVLLTPKGDVITKLVGPRDATVVRTAIERSIEYPYAPDELAQRTDTPSHLRWIEVILEKGDIDSAVAAAIRYVGADTSLEAAHGQYLYAYAVAEKGEFEKAKKATEEYLDRYPDGKDRSTAHWILIVLELQSDKDAGIEARIDRMIAEDSTAAHVRQAIWAYTMEYLARGKGNLKKAESLLTKYIDASTPWSNDLRIARANLRTSIPNSMGDAIEDYKLLASSEGTLSNDAKDRLVMIAGAPGNDLILPGIVLYFQDLASKSTDDGYARFLLARLYLMSDNVPRAIEEAKTLAATDGEYADEAALLLGVIKLEVEKKPEEAIPFFEDVIKKYADRSTFWPARYGWSRSLFFSGRLKEAKEANAGMIEYLSNRFYLSEAFLLILPQAAPPQAIAEQLKDYNEKIDSLLAEKDGEKIFKELLTGVLAGSKGDTAVADVAFNSVVTKYPASSLADDALFELAKVHLRDNQMDSAAKALERIMTSYKGSDQYKPAEELLGMINQAGQQPSRR